MLRFEQVPVTVIGAGPAGLTAAWELCRAGQRASVLEAGNYVGGLSRTVDYRGYLFDIGGHRFYTKSQTVEAIWNEVLGADFIARARSSRIFYRGKFFQYPLQPLNALAGLGPVEAFRCVASYIAARIAPVRPEDNFAAWVSNRFGRRLFETFFKTYTEKVWGMSCERISADWAAQRIKDLNVASLLADTFTPLRTRAGSPIKTLIREFHYPRRGPGMLWERMAELICERGAAVMLGSPVERIEHRGGRVRRVFANGVAYESESYISSMPLRALVNALDPAPPVRVRRALQDLKYRDFITVVLIVAAPEIFPDQWIYVHEPRVKVGRIQNYKQWSPEMVPDPANTSLGFEYFASEGDALWSLGDEELLALAASELGEMGLARGAAVVDGTVVRARKAYPVYDARYRQNVATVRDYLATLENFQQVGRNGMHRYNNQDHSMITGIMAARNIMGAKYDIWDMADDCGYLEGAPLGDEQLAAVQAAQPRVPARIAAR